MEGSDPSAVPLLLQASLAALDAHQHRGAPYRRPPTGSEGAWLRQAPRRRGSLIETHRVSRISSNLTGETRLCWRRACIHDRLSHFARHTPPKKNPPPRGRQEGPGAGGGQEAKGGRHPGSVRSARRSFHFGQWLPAIAGKQGPKKRGQCPKWLARVWHFRHHGPEGAAQIDLDALSNSAANVLGRGSHVAQRTLRPRLFLVANSGHVEVGVGQRQSG